MFIIPMILFFLAGCEEKNTITDFGCGSEITVKPGYPIDKGDIEEISPLLPRTVPASAVTVTGTQINLTSTLVRNEVKETVFQKFRHYGCGGKRICNV